MKSVNKITQEFSVIPTLAKAKASLWYYDANNFAKAVAKQHQISLIKVCGVISALSPSNEWNNNKIEAQRMIEIYLKDGDFTSEAFTITKFRTYGNNVAKAIQILDLDDSNFMLKEQVSDILFGKAGYKTRNFFHNILDPENEYKVTIDRHMLTYLGEKSVKSGAHYAKMEKRICEAAKQIGLVPSSLQAILWEEQIRRNKVK